MTDTEKKTWHPLIERILEALPEDLRDERSSTEPDRGPVDAEGRITSAQLTRHAHVGLERGGRQWRRGAPFGKVRLNLRSGSFYGNPRPRLYPIKDDGSFNLQKLLDSVREHEESEAVARQREEEARGHQQREVDRLEDIRDRFALPAGWRSVVDDRGRKVVLQRGRSEYGDGQVYYRTSDDVHVADDEGLSVSGKLTIQRLPMEKFNQILAILGEE